jgi:hypothetical protein
MYRQTLTLTQTQTLEHTYKHLDRIKKHHIRIVIFLKKQILSINSHCTKFTLLVKIYTSDKNI